MKTFDITEIQKQDIINKYVKEKLPFYVIAKDYDCNYTTIRRWLKKWEIEIREYNKLWGCDENYFETIDTPEKAYLLGFMYSDGCVRDGKNRQKQIMLGLHHEDREVLENFKQELKFEGPIYLQDKSGSTCFFDHGKKYYQCANVCRMNVSSDKLCNDLIKLGCEPRKTLTCKFPTTEQVPENLMKYFILGYFDGDGCISINKQNMGYVIFCGTENFLKGLRNWFSANLQFNEKVKVSQRIGCFNLTYGGNKQIRKFYETLYEGINFGLARKKNKFIQLFS